MPGGDRTGPQGEGPKTGRGLGYCADNDQPGFVRLQPALGLGQGNRWGRRDRGRGRGRRNRRFWPGRYRDVYGVSGGAQNQYIASLQEQVEELQNTLLEIHGKLSELAPEDEERK
jgi:hypothetical protein